jgi:hypothetical protein
VTPLTPARAARRQLLVDRITEYLAERCGSEERAAGYARDIRGIVDDLGFTLPEAIDDPPPARGADGPPSGPGYQAFQEARAALAQRRDTA